ncbi:MAG: SOS response-associated peptidase [Lamprobacter sp.]|uniref:SOS response-associated peptidase n=1 Tax=Lamprobacter sp. TaxID=3100796 RepID=UPI002B256926|nr:SOS response-associated peptidase [Lamprobacter sp.]MEA3642646.1 SOS response-associated peptidase [Lamprobacter sp.]
MCGRFNISPSAGMADLLESFAVKLPAGYTRYNIAPTEEVPLVLQTGELAMARWRLTPSWSDGPSQKYAMFNARCETLTSSPAFRGPFARQRGVVPMSSFLEWRKEGAVRQPWRISNIQQALMVAALWDRWIDPAGDALLSCTLVTTAAAPEFTPWHSRMPVLLTVDEAARWLDNSLQIAKDDRLFEPALKFPLLLEPVDRRVGNARNKAAQDQAIVGDVLEIWRDHAHASMNGPDPGTDCGQV